MSQSWPPDRSQPPRQSSSRPLYGPPSQGGDRSYPNYAPPDQGYGRPNPDYGPPSQRQYGGGWPPPGNDQWPPQSRDEDPRGDPRYAQYPQYQQYPEQSQYPQYQPNQPYPEQSQYPQYQPNQQYQQYQQYQQSPYAGNPYGSPYGYGPPVAEPEPRRGTNWLLPIVIVVLLVLVGGAAFGAYALTHRGAPGNTAAATSSTATTATSAIPAGFRQFTDTATHVRFVIPKDWSNTGSLSASNGLVIGSPDQNSAMAVKQFNAVGNNTEAAGQFFVGVAGSGGSITNKAGPTNAHLAGETWVQESADVTRDGVTVHAVVLVTTHADATYVIGYLANASSFSSVNTQYFQPVLNSFVFTQ